MVVLMEFRLGPPMVAYLAGQLGMMSETSLDYSSVEMKEIPLESQKDILMALRLELRSVEMMEGSTVGR